MDETSFSNYLDRFITKLTPQLPAERHDYFRKNADAAVKWLKSKVKDLKLYEMNRYIVYSSICTISKLPCLFNALPSY